jgi:hypothetical protein
MSRNSRRRNNLFKRGNTCIWCGVTLVYVRVDAWPKGTMPENFATVDHLYDRLTYPNRHQKVPAQEERTVLACRTCNQRRNREQQLVLARARRAHRRLAAAATSTPAPGNDAARAA